VLCVTRLALLTVAAVKTSRRLREISVPAGKLSARLHAAANGTGAIDEDIATADRLWATATTR